MEPPVYTWFPTAADPGNVSHIGGGARPPSFTLWQMTECEAWGADASGAEGCGADALLTHRPARPLAHPPELPTTNKSSSHDSGRQASQKIASAFAWHGRGPQRSPGGVL